MGSHIFQNVQLCVIFAYGITHISECSAVCDLCYGITHMTESSAVCDLCLWDHTYGRMFTCMGSLLI